MESSTDIVSWVIELEGDQFDKDAMARSFARGETRVSIEGSKAYLSSSQFHGLPNSTHAREIAIGVLAEMNGAMSLLNRSEPLRVGLVVPMHRDGSRGKPVNHGSANIRLRAATMTGAGTVSGPDGVRWDADQRSDAQKWIELAQSDEHVADALTFLSGSVTWFELWKAFEEVQESLEGGRKFIWREDVKWSTKTETVRFALTVQHFRHANQPLPDDPMTFDDAFNWLRSIVQQWIEWKRAQAT